jgi:hypothetical protein
MHRTSSRFFDGVPDGNAVIDVVFDGANLNPARLDCPTREVLEQLAGRILPIEHAGYSHLAQCSQCYREFRTMRTRRGELPRQRKRGQREP